MNPISDDARHEFSWDTLRLFLEGFSPVDLQNLAITSRQEAMDFISAYGYDLNNPPEEEEAREIHREAIEFLERYLCPSMLAAETDLVIPDEVREPSHLADMLLLSSDKDQPYLAAWACSALRVMHTISHANLAARTPYFAEVQAQILGPFEEHLFPDPEAPQSLGQGPSAVPLRACFFKRRKSRESMILKLLHKPDNVASEVYDRIGIKLVTPTKVDALRALKYLRKQNLVSLPLLTPGRSRNTLVDLNSFREAYDAMTSAQPTNNEEEADQEFSRQLAFRPAGEAKLLEDRMVANPHSSPHFRAIQFTCRRLVKVRHPANKMLDQLREKTGNRELGKEIESDYPELLRFTFPFEIQITDWENYLSSREGESSHICYKRRQLKAARKRVLGQVLLLENQRRRLAKDRRGRLLDLTSTVVDPSQTLSPEGGASKGRIVTEDAGLGENLNSLN